MESILTDSYVYTTSQYVLYTVQLIQDTTIIYPSFIVISALSISNAYIFLIYIIAPKFLSLPSKFAFSEIYGINLKRQIYDIESVKTGRKNAAFKSIVNRGWLLRLYK